MSNLEQVLDQATDDDVSAGKAWYHVAHDLAKRIAKEHNLELDPVVGVIAALSPCSKWGQNIRDAETVIKAWVNGEDPEGVKVCAFGQNKRKAFKILEAGTRHGILGGMKVTDFADQVEDPQRGIAVVDTHAYNAYVGERVLTSKSKRKVTPKMYREVQGAYNELAEKLDMRADQVQAMTWLVWRKSLQ